MSASTYRVDVFRDGRCIETYRSAVDLDDPKQKTQAELLKQAVGRHGRSPADAQEYGRFELIFRDGWGQRGTYRGAK